MPTWLAYEPHIRLGVFAGLFALLAMMELLFPRRRSVLHKSSRWPHQGALFVVNAILVRVLLPLSLVGLGLHTEAAQIGVLQWIPSPVWLRILLAVLLLDLLIYGQHVLFHRVPMLWRIHRVHHADLEFDVTTGLRFHTIEILLSVLIKVAGILLIGAPGLAVLIFEVLLNAGSMFSHSNWRLPLWCDRILRNLIVTPDMHRVHHSVIVPESNRNFGFNLSWWDRLFRTYQDQPAAGHDGMTIGLSEYRDEKQTQQLTGMLVLPWQSTKADNSKSVDA